MIPELVADLNPPPYAMPWWQGLREHRLTVQRCIACGNRQHYPRPVCVACGGTELAFEAIAPVGVVLSATTIHRAPLPELRQYAPYSVALVELDHGIRMFGAIVAESPIVEIIGTRVVTGFTDVTDAITLLRFAAADD